MVVYWCNTDVLSAHKNSIAQFLETELIEVCCWWNHNSVVIRQAKSLQPQSLAMVCHRDSNDGMQLEEMKELFTHKTEP